VLLLALAGAPEGAAVRPAQRVKLDGGWRFAFGRQDRAEREDFPDAGWQPVTVPHTWNAEDAFTREPTFREGDGWYRRRVTLDPALAGKCLVLRFEAANQVTDVYWNGTHVGHHSGGYTAFAIDVTKVARVGGGNVLAVRVNNAIGPVPPLIADYNFYGGLYRDVWLIASDPVHFSLLDHGAPGVWAEPMGVSEASATVRVRGQLSNSGARPVRVEILARVLDPDGKAVLSSRAELDAAPA
jgi:beta-galactosidase